MIIGIDARVLLEGRGGIFVYTKNLLPALIPLARSHQIKLFVNRYRSSDAACLAWLLKYPNVKLYSYRFPNKLLNLVFRAGQWPRIDKLIAGCDILFFPAMLYGAWSPPIPTVLTMHDLSFEIWPEFFTVRQRVWHQLMAVRELCQKVSRVIAVSESTRQDLIRLYNLAPARVSTVLSGVAPDWRPIIDRELLDQVRRRYQLPAKKFILQLGTLEPRKNGLATLLAWQKWRQDYRREAEPYDLLFVGQVGWKSGDLRQAIARSRWRNQVHIVTNVPRPDLPALYNLADMVVYPSFYEGFGFPPLEALACGVPVIASATSSLGETVGDAGLLIDPYRIDDMVEAMHSLVSDPNLAKTLRARGIARTVEFSWEKTARETLKVLESV